MVHIGTESERILRRSLGRMQACIDQLVGQDVFVEAGASTRLAERVKETRKTVLKLLQKELDLVFTATEQHSPSAEADGSEWLLRQLKP